jgi:trimeric autotransporter adhesin
MGATASGLSWGAGQWAGWRPRLGFSAWMLAAMLAIALLGASAAMATSTPPSPVPEVSWVANGSVTDVAWSGHTLYIGGDFSRVGPPTGPFAILNGTSGAQEGSGPIVAGGEANVETIIPDGHGGWYIGGNFTSVGGAPIRNLAHITSTDTLDAGVAPNPNQTVHALALSTNGETLYATGDFHEIGGQDRSGIAAINTATGLARSGFTAGFNVGESEDGSALALASNTNTLYVGAVGGYGPVHSRLKAFDATTGAVDAAFKAEADAVGALAVSPDDQTLYVAGASSIDGEARNGLGAVNATTGAVMSFNPPGSTSYPALSLALTNDGTALYAGGLNGLQKISTATGTVDKSLSANPGEVIALALSADQSKLYVSSQEYVGGLNREVFQRLNATTGAVENTFSLEPNVTPSTVATSSTGTVAVGGGAQIAIEGSKFNSLGGVKRGDFAAIDETTGQPTSLELPYCYRFALSPDGSTLYGLAPNIGKPGAKLIRVNTTTGAISSSFSAEVKGGVLALAMSPDGGTLYVGGNLSEVDGHAAKNLAALNTSDGSLTTGFTASTDGAWHAGSGPGLGIVDSLTVSPDGLTLYVGGYFTEVDGQHRESLAAVSATSGTLDSEFTPGIPSQEASNDAVFATVTNAVGGSLYVRGWFGLKLLDAKTGSPSLAFAPSLLEGGAGVALSPDGSTVYAGGYNKLSGAFDATTGASIPAFNPAIRGSATIDVLAFAPDGALAAAGNVSNVDQTPVGGFAIFPPSEGPPANAALPETSRPFPESASLSASTGTWAGSQPLSFSYQWLRDGSAITGATASTYQPTAADEGHQLAVEVTATNGNGHASATSFSVVVPASNPGGEGPGGEKGSGGGGNSGGGAGSGGGGATAASAGGSATSSNSSGQVGPSPSAIAAALGAALNLKSPPTISSLLKTGRYSLSFTAPGPGVLAIQWTSTTAQASKHASHKAKPVVVASGSKTFGTAGISTVMIRVTAAGRKLLKKSKTLKVIEMVTFTPSSGSAQTKQASLTIRAGQKARR